MAAMKAVKDGARPWALLLMTPTTYRAADFLQGASAAGVEIVVGTSRAQSLQGLAPDRNLTLPFHDLAAAGERVRQFHRAHPLSAVVGVDDEATLVAARVAETLGLPHNSVGAVAASRNKAAMRRCFAAAGLASPGFVVCRPEAAVDQVQRHLSYPCVVKPLFLAASRGVVRADDPVALGQAATRIQALLEQPEVKSRGHGDEAGQVLVETFIPGEEVALEGLLEQGRLRSLALFDKPDPLDGPTFEETLFVTPSRQTPAVQEEIIRSGQQAASALGLSQGPVHAEFRVNRQGVWILELAARSIGGLCSRTLRFGTGLSLEEIILRQACRLPIASLRRESQAAGVMMLPIPDRGILREVRGTEAAAGVDGIEEVVISVPVGQEITPLPEGNRYLGFLFARARTPAAVETALREAHQRLGFSISP